MQRPPTLLVSLQRLLDPRALDRAETLVEPVVAGWPGSATGQHLVGPATQLDFDGCPAIWLAGRGADAAGWAEAAGILLILVGNRCYALTSGHPRDTGRIRDDAVEQRFGLRVAIRSLPPAQLRALCSPLTPSPGELLRRISGRDLRATSSTKQQAPNTPADHGFRVQGPAGLRVRLATDPVGLVSDLRAIATLHDLPAPLPELALADHVAPVGDAATRRRLDLAAETLLEPAAPTPKLSGVVTYSIPGAALSPLEGTASSRIQVGPVSSVYTTLGLADLRAAALAQPPGLRLSALRTGSVSLCELPGGHRQRHRSAAVKWIEVTLVDRGRHFTLLEGIWYEFDPEFVTRTGRELAAVSYQVPATELEAWWRPPAPDQSEPDREHPLGQPPHPHRSTTAGRTDSHPSGPGSDCLLGPRNELVFALLLAGTPALTKVLTQGRELWHELSAPATRVHRLRQQIDAGPQIPTDFVPDRVVFAVLPAPVRYSFDRPGDDRRAVDQFVSPFALDALHRTAADLHRHGVRVELTDLGWIRDGRLTEAG